MATVSVDFDTSRIPLPNRCGLLVGERLMVESDGGDVMPATVELDASDKPYLRLIVRLDSRARSVTVRRVAS